MAGIPGWKKASEAVALPVLEAAADDHLKAADLVITECHYFQKFINAKQEKTAVVYWPKEVPEGWKMEAPENEAPESPAVIHFAYLGSINNIIDIDGIVNFLEITGKMTPVFLHVVGDGENERAF